MIETKNKDYGKMALQYFGASFFIVLFVCMALLFFLKISFPHSLLLGSIAGACVGLFVVTAVVRNLKVEYFEINQQNKERDKGLAVYRQELERALVSLSYEKEFDNSETLIYRPSIRARAMGGEVQLKYTPYSIGIQGPRGIVRILASLTGVKKIIL